MVDINNLKYEVYNLVSDAKKAADKIEKEAIPSCDVFQLSFLIGDTDEARGAAGVLTKIYPEDQEIKDLWKDATSAHIRTYKGRDKFIEQCKCSKKK